VKTMALVSSDRHYNRSASVASSAIVGAGGEAEVGPRSSSAHGIPVVAVDVPSGWDVDKGDIHDTGLRPAMLVSLTGAFRSSLWGLQIHFDVAKRTASLTTNAAARSQHHTWYPCLPRPRLLELLRTTQRLPGLGSSTSHMPRAAPKQCSQCFEGPHHWLGGRFVPRWVLQRGLCSR
jgi:hypothetical protein